jgi:hypothetical protein
MEWQDHDTLSDRGMEAVLCFVTFLTLVARDIMQIIYSGKLHGNVCCRLTEDVYAQCRQGDRVSSSTSYNRHIHENCPLRSDCNHNTEPTTHYIYSLTMQLCMNAETMTFKCSS